jgi:hypothetical protein
MEGLDLRDIIADEVQYRGLPETVTDDAIRYLRGSDRLMELLDMVVYEAICHVVSDT